MVLPLIALAGGAALRTVGTRLLAGAATKQAAGGAVGGGGGMSAGRALQFGGSALQMSGTRQHQSHQLSAPKPPASGGMLGPKGEMGLGVLASGVLSSPQIFDSAAQDFDSIMQAGQFKPQS